ncbi:MFS transporter [Aeromicrobium endophyticum]|uniref:MFS transporter n=1 Tax=Aeromicrobium endophyticum TaxID=2292704 RepID=A0A371PBP1_9ACTN|nr:MFS transporter [Aeromicrobium endophyticum]REK73342.1 MFS transporter [Aeromicrobium endophyticum]
MQTRTPDKWLMLAVSMLGQVSGTLFVNAAPFLIPYLVRERGLSLVQAGFVASAPLLGITVTLFAWGVVVDRLGERFSMVTGLGLVTVCAVAAAWSGSLVALATFLFIGGAAGGSTNSASGRIVVGWFPPHRRGLAMGIRQTGLPLGVGLAAVIVPNLVASRGLTTTLLVIAAACAVGTVLCAVLIVDPPRPDRAAADAQHHLANPYRGDRRLLRIHAVSVLLVVPQFTVWTYMLVWLIDTKEWSTHWASILVAVTQLLGAAGRIGVGAWSDRVGSRLAPLRQVAVLAAVTMLLLGFLEPTPVAVVLIVVATVVTVADNGLAFTAVAEIGGPFWSGRAMGIQNTGQYLVSAAVPPVVGALVTGLGYEAAFALVAVFPLLAIALVPVRGEHAKA